MKKVLFILFTATLLIAACSDSNPPAPVTDDQSQDDKKDDGPTSQLHKLTREWKIESAYHDGIPDGSSTGKTVEFFEMHSFNFDGIYDGVYEWSQDSNTLYLDPGTQYSQDWEIVKLDKENFEVNFNSPFTGKPSKWVMVLNN